MNTYPVAAVAIAFWLSLASLATAQQATIVELRRIWDHAPHNAFTDLVRWNGRWYCSFREGTGHVNYHGKARVITSLDGVKWESALLIRDNFSDLRDPKLCVTPNNELMISGPGAMHPPIAFKHQSLAWFTTDGREYGEASKIGEPNMWLWRTTWHKNVGYCVGYSTVEPRVARLYTTRTGRKFDVLVDKLSTDGYPNESTLAFLPDDTAMCLLRRDGEETGGLNHARLGVARPPYTTWQWKDVGHYVGGPNLIVLPDGRVIAAGRKLIDPATDPQKLLFTEGKLKGKPMIAGRRTALWQVDLATGKFTELLVFPSGGDTSYPGLVWHEGHLYVSYYSSHEGKTNIYFAKVKLP